MTPSHRFFLVAVVLGGLAQGATDQPVAFRDESLRYAVNWPSGLSLGEASLSSRRSGAGWEFDFTLDAGIPGFPIADRFHSVTDGNLCSQEFERDTRHGSKKSSEKSTFDYRDGFAHRKTANGGTSDVGIPARCAMDALAYLYSARNALARGSVPQPDKLYFGSAYAVRLENIGQQSVTVAGKPTESDHVTVHLQGPASNSTFEIFFARDAARTPLLVKIPSGVGTISLELAR